MNISYFIKEVKLIEIWPLAEVKNYLRVSHNYDDPLIASLIEAAKEAAEKFTGLSLNHRIIECRVQNAKKNLTLKYLPILNIAEASLLKKEQREIITDKFDPANVANCEIQVRDEYIGQDLEIRYIAGYREIPKPLKHAILMHVSLMYDCPENGIRLTSPICDLYQPYRIMKI